MPVYGRWGSVNGQLDYKFEEAPKEQVRSSVFGLAAQGSISFGNGGGRLCIICGRSLRKNFKGRAHSKCPKD